MSPAERAQLEAAEWLIAQADGPLAAGEQARFDAWMQASEGNKAAYWRLEFGWEEAARIRALGLEADGPTAPARPSRRWLPLAIAASVAALVAAPYMGELLPTAVPHRTALQPSASFATGVGMRRTVGLPDGSHVQLNTQSAMRTRISPSRREVWLNRGEAFFEVTHRDRQPFIVHAGDRQITVLGTKFSVRRDGAKVVVSVLEGRVQLDELQNRRPIRSSIIVGGDVAMAVGAATLVTARSERKVEDALSWREGVLTFDQEPLAGIATEFNRYNDRKLEVDPDIARTLRITGVFPLNKPDAFARLLRDAYGLEVSETDKDILVSAEPGHQKAADVRTE